MAFPFQKAIKKNQPLFNSKMVLEQNFFVGEPTYVGQKNICNFELMLFGCAGYFFQKDFPKTVETSSTVHADIVVPGFYFFKRNN